MIAPERGIDVRKVMLHNRSGCEHRQVSQRLDWLAYRVGGAKARRLGTVKAAPTAMTRPRPTISCVCGGLVDIRDLAQVMEHAEPLPHPVGDRPQ